MGQICSKGDEEYNEALKVIKEIIKNKSVYQYQIAHFKILNIEKRIVPTAEYLQYIKIRKIITDKKLKDLRKTLVNVLSQYDEGKDIGNLRFIEEKLEGKLKELREMKQNINEDLAKIKVKKRMLELLEGKKNSLMHRNQLLEMKQMKYNYTKRFSIQVLQNIKPLEGLAGGKSALSHFVLNQRLEDYDRCLDRLLTMIQLAIKFQNDNHKARILKLESRIASLKLEKQKILEVNSSNIIEMNNSINLEKILEEINSIKSQRLDLKIENNEINRWELALKLERGV
ncbi:hypothetical protein SteCoe_28355 [Stentor coeruleus]|uniref:Uncharacterized protein n=1 Tax=Stentor coeruleus TaxID=5963 RepID=A0A1R2B8D6_9CILI|nr:hypothetical protein SteCoe_28355 [Stentor coeruleus]